MGPIRVIVNEFKTGFNQSKWLPLITAYVVLSGIIGPGIHYQYLHLPFIVIGLLLSLKGGLKVEIAPLLLLLYLPLNIAVAKPDGIFNSWLRLALFYAVFVFASPLLRGNNLGVYRKKILTGILFICVLLGLGSFVCYFFGVNYMLNQYDGSIMLDYQGSSGKFGGLMIQSIVLGMVCGLGMLYLLYRALNQNKKNRIWYYLGIIVLALTLLISASRSALLSAITGMLMMLFQANKKRGKFIQALIVIIFLGMLTYPLWEQYTAGLATKRSVDMEQGTYGSRTGKWTARITEFKSSPIYGIGFASIDDRLDDIGIGGVVEPGSSWLGILSMTGIIGLILVVIILIKPFQFLRAHPTPYNALLLGLLVFICTHMASEGYIYAGGSPLCFTAWLIFGCCNDARYVSDG